MSKATKTTKATVQATDIAESVAFVMSVLNRKIGGTAYQMGHVAVGSYAESGELPAMAFAVHCSKHASERLARLEAESKDMNVREVLLVSDFLAKYAK